MTFDELKRIQSRFNYILKGIPESFEILLRNCNLSLCWDDFPAYDIEKSEDQSKILRLQAFFDEIKREWQSEVKQVKTDLYQVIIYLIYNFNHIIFIVQI